MRNSILFRLGVRETFDGKIRRCPPEKKISGRGNLIFYGTNGQKHWGLGGVTILRTRQRPNIKKAGRYPMREIVGSAKNPLKKRQRNVQQDTKTQWSLLEYFAFLSKRAFLKLGGFTISFAEITDVMSSETIP